MHEVKYLSGARVLAFGLAIVSAGLAGLILAVYGPAHFHMKWSYPQFVTFSCIFLVTSSYAALARNSWLFDYGNGQILRCDRDFLGTHTSPYASFDHCLKVRVTEIEHDEAPNSWVMEILIRHHKSILINEESVRGNCPDGLRSQARTLSRILDVPFELQSRATVLARSR